ncbi:restriction endonuclease subunit S [Enterobacter cancerogenus]|uniref:restriction endonuclease subunit S n=1 Tax=Enterobacter cancerogenus TaxID=69218 RepID=UPI00380F6655
MGSKWEYIPLGELITLQRGHDLPSQHRIDGPVPIMGSSGITGFHNIAKAAGPGVIVGRSGDSMGVVSFIEKDYWPLNTCLYITDFKGNDITYIYYLLKLVNFDIFNSGSAQKSLNRNALYPHKVLATKDRVLQKKIGAILSSFEARILNTNKINQTLEKMSQTLFKSWFVDFDPVIDNALDAGNPIPEALQSRAELRQKVRNSADAKPLPADIRALFPAEFEDTELGWVPKGWNIDNVGRLSENIFSGGTPNTSTEEYWNGTLNWFSSGETRNTIIIETEKKITEAGVKNSSTRLSISGDILIASAGQGHTRGQTSLNTIDTYINQSVVCIRPMKSSYSSWLYFNISSRYEEMRAISDSHSIRGSLTTKLIASMKVISPTDNLISLFDKSCSTFIKKMRNNLQLSCELKKLRDTLLPKLISGELSLEELPDLIKQTEPA